MLKNYPAIIALLLFGVSAHAQAPPTPLGVTQYQNVTATSPLDGQSAGVFYIDNRSQFTRHNDYFSYWATGTGTWSVTMQYADGAPQGWTSFGSTAVVTQAAPSSGIGFGTGYHDFVSFVIAGAATIQVSATKGFYIAAAVASVNYPIAAGQGGTGSSNLYGWAQNLTYLNPGSGAVAVPMQTLMNQTVSPLSFGAVCTVGSTHDDGPAIQAAINWVATSYYGGYVEMPPEQCNTKQTIEVLDYVRLKGKGSSNSGVVAIPGFPGGASTCVMAIVPALTNPTSLGCTETASATYGASIEDMTINAAGIAGYGIVAPAIEELSYIEHVPVYNYLTGGILLGPQLGGIQNTSIHGITGGPFNGACGPLITVDGAAGRFSVTDVSGTSYPTFCDRGLIENSADGGRFEDIHCENFFTCFGDVAGEAEVENVYGLGNVTATVYQCGGPGLANGSTHMNCSGGAGLLAKHILSNPSNGYNPGTANLVDDINHVVICNGYPVSGQPCGPFPLSYQLAVATILNIYDSQAPGVSTYNNLYTSEGGITTKLGSLSVNGNIGTMGLISPGGPGIGWPKTNPAAAPYGLGGLVFVMGGNNPNGLLIQGQNTIGNDTSAGGGLQVMGNGVQADPAYGMIGAGLTGDGGSFYQRGQTSAGMMQFNDGAIQFLQWQGLPAGNVGGLLLGGLSLQVLPATTFLNLGSPGPATYRYCNDCTTTSPTNNACAGGGEGDWAFTTGYGWKCL